MNIRRVRPEDAGMLAALSVSLGYEIDVADTRSSIEHLGSETERLVLAAVIENEVIGWVDAAVERHLQSETVVVINGIVIQEDLRGKNIGQKLCRAVEVWAIETGISRVRVRSQEKRSDAHRFYMRDGYQQVKVSVVFEKRLNL